MRSMRLKCQNKYFPYGPKSRLIRALLYTYPNKTVQDEILLSLGVVYCQCVTRSIRRSVRLCTDCLSANQIKEFVPYFNQYTRKCGIHILNMLFGHIQLKKQDTIYPCKSKQFNTAVAIFPSINNKFFELDN